MTILKSKSQSKSNQPLVITEVEEAQSPHFRDR